MCTVLHSVTNVSEQKSWTGDLGYPVRAHAKKLRIKNHQNINERKAKSRVYNETTENEFKNIAETKGSKTTSQTDEGETGTKKFEN